MSAAFAVSLFPYYNNVIFSAVFLPVLFQQFLPVPYFFLFRFWFGSFPSRPSRCSIFSLPKNFLLLFSCLLPNFFPKLLPASPVGFKKLSCPYRLYKTFAVFLTFRLCSPFSAKTFLSEVPSPRSLQPLSLACITISLELICPPRLQSLCRLSYVSLVSSVFCKDLPVRNSVSMVFTVFAPCLHPRRPETDLSENLSRLRAVFPANLLSKLYFLSLSRCFRF